MKVKHKNISSSETDTWVSIDHLVLAYGVWDENSKIFLEHIPENKKLQIIKNLISQVKYVTIATSPYFIDQ